MGFTLYLLSRPKRSGEKCILQKYSGSLSNNTALPKYNQIAYRLTKLQVQSQPAIGSHVGTMHSFAAFLLEFGTAS